MGYLDKKGLAYFWGKIKTALSTKQNNLTPGDGIAIENDTISVITPVKGMTQTEYDAIANKEQSGLCVVTDANVSLNGGGDNYFTEETMIGTWIDRKPIYRKVVDLGVLESSSPNGPTIKNVEMLVDARVVFYNKSTHRYYVQPSLNASVGLVNGVVTVFISNSNLYDGSYSGTAIFEYTKTTD